LLNVFRHRRAGLRHAPAEAFNNLGIAYEQLGRLVEARHMYTRALQLDPGNSWIKENLRRFVEIEDRRVRPIAARGPGAPTAAPGGGTPASAMPMERWRSSISCRTARLA
jgi:tetratricopeptide (TPR) repeat protein